LLCLSAQAQFKAAREDAEARVTAAQSEVAGLMRQLEAAQAERGAACEAQRAAEEQLKAVEERAAAEAARLEVRAMSVCQTDRKTSSGFRLEVGAMYVCQTDLLGLSPGGAGLGWPEGPKGPLLAAERAAVVSIACREGCRWDVCL
jgi:hypothetical protein